jgi:cytochrome c-type biogenesis protein CcmF
LIAELGHLIAFMALASALAQAVVGLTSGGEAARRLALATGGLAITAFLILVFSFVRLDFSLQLVADHAHSQQPLLYRIAATWGNHEGSMLLWCCIMAGYGVAGALAMRPDALRDKALGVQGLLTAGSLAYLLFASSPFVRAIDPPWDGRGLNPLLQDPAVAAHPPTTYMGYVGFSFTFSIAAAGLILGRIDSEWAKRARPWALVAWSFLTFGILVGSYWSYYELGWGGWWFWDPVENASFMPWLVGAALVHSLTVTQKRGGMAAWTSFLAVLAFCLSVMGTFLVRSGVLTSVHSFAVDPKRGLVLLVGLALAAGGAFTLYAWRAPKLKPGPEYDPVSREGALVLNNLFLSVGAGIVLFGTATPLVLQAFGITMSIGEPWFHYSIVPIMGILFLFLPLAEAAPWRHADLTPMMKRLIPAAAIAAVAALAAYAVYPESLWLVPGVLIGAWVVAGVVTDLLRRIGGGGIKRLGNLPGSVWGMTIAHIGLGVFLIGAVSETAARTERTVLLMPGEQVEMRGRTFRFDGVEEVEGPNYTAQRAKITVTKDGSQGLMAPERRFYPASTEGGATTEVAIRKTLGGDVYIALGEPVRERPGAWRMRISHHPMVDWVFGGVGLISIGGFAALAARRRRPVEAPASAPGVGGEKPVEALT